VRRLADAAPDLVAELDAALTCEGHRELAKQLSLLLLGQISVDEIANMAYVDVHYPGLSEDHWHKARESLSTVCLAQPYCFNIDLDVADRICGIEICGRTSVALKLCLKK